jgi:hypothetical protein
MASDAIRILVALKSQQQKNCTHSFWLTENLQFSASLPNISVAHNQRWGRFMSFAG